MKTNKSFFKAAFFYALESHDPAEVSMNEHTCVHFSADRY